MSEYHQFIDCEEPPESSSWNPCEDGMSCSEGSQRSSSVGSNDLGFVESVKSYGWEVVGTASQSVADKLGDAYDRVASPRSKGVPDTEVQGLTTHLVLLHDCAVNSTAQNTLRCSSVTLLHHDSF